MTEFEEAYLAILKDQAEKADIWRQDALRLIAQEVGAKMRSPSTSAASYSQCKAVLDNAKWAYKEATGQQWPEDVQQVA